MTRFFRLFLAVSVKQLCIGFLSLSRYDDEKSDEENESNPNNLDENNENKTFGNSITIYEK